MTSLLSAELPFLPLPSAALDENQFVEEQKAAGAASGDIIPYVTK